MRETTEQLERIERSLHELWIEALPDITSARVEDLVVAHRAVHEAVTVLRQHRDLDDGHTSASPT